MPMSYPLVVNLGEGAPGKGRGSQDWEEEGPKGLRATAIPVGTSVPPCLSFPADSISLAWTFSAQDSHFRYVSATDLFSAPYSMRFLRLQCFGMISFLVLLLLLSLTQCISVTHS